MQVLNNAKIYTFDPHQPQAEALAIENGRILTVGSDEEVRAIAPLHTKWIDLEGRTILPGLTDSHIHLENYALGLQRVDCETQTRADCLRRVQQKAHNSTAGVWVRGHGWNQNLWSDGFGCAAELDAVAPANPVYLTAKSLHAAWVNTRALELANITHETPDPPGGKIDRDPAGKPAGILFETAIQLVERSIPEPAVSEVTACLREAQQILWQFGITGVHDFDQRRCFTALQNLHGSGELRLRVLKSIPMADMEHAIALGLRSGFGDDFLRIGSVKLFSDGALGPLTAAMLQPYENTQDKLGMLLLNTSQIYEIGCQAVANGFSLAVHAIGDRANREALEAFEQLRAFELDQGLPAYRHRIEHVQLLHPDDLNRLVRLNLIASVQPIHATSDMDMAERHWGKRAAYSYAYGALHKHGTLLTLGSDAPVESPNPFWGIHAAVTRCRRDGSPSPKGWYPTQRLTLQDALYGYTVTPAITAGVQDRLGKIASGFHADLLVLESDPFDTPPQEIQHIRPQAVMVGGEWVWQT